MPDCFAKTDQCSFIFCRRERVSGVRRREQSPDAFNDAAILGTGDVFTSSRDFAPLVVLEPSAITSGFAGSQLRRARLLNEPPVFRTGKYPSSRSVSRLRIVDSNEVARQE